MKKLSKKRIEELINQTKINIDNFHKTKEFKKDYSFDEYQYIFDELKNINSIDDESIIKSNIIYWSCSSNFWIGAEPLMNAYEERLSNSYKDIKIDDKK